MTAGSCTDRTRPRQARVQVGDIARAYGDALRDHCNLTPHQHQVLRSLERCRTAELGGHLHVCDHCGHTVPMYNSCRDRHCPTCQSLEQHKWLERREQAILPSPYFHVVFTLPDALRPVVAQHREKLFGMLFSAASLTLLLLARDPKRLGAMPAITMVLHTWTRQLAFHPHVHAIVSAGGLTEEGAWKASRADYLFPVKVMAWLFRRLFRESLLGAIEAGELDVPTDLVEPMRHALFDKKWVVYAKAPFGGAKQVFAYLGRYTHRVGISNARILGISERGVTFATKNGRTCTLLPMEFLRRLLLHVLPKGFHKIRHYGLCSTTHVARGTLDAARAQLEPSKPVVAKPPPAPAPDARAAASGDAPQTWLEWMLALAGIDLMRCPHCAQGRMRRVALELHVLPRRQDSS